MAPVPPRPIARGGLRLRRHVTRLLDRLLPVEIVVFERAMAIGGGHVIATVAELGVCDVLAAGGPQTAEQLAPQVGADADALHRLLRAAAAMDVVRLDRRGRFRPGRLAGGLRSDAPRSMRPWARYMGSAATSGAWAGLTESVRTGEPAFPRVNGRSVWDHFAAHPEEEAQFAASMRALTELVAPSVVARWDWPPEGVVCDVGGGVGTLLAAVLDARPGLRGVVVDAPGVLAEAQAFLAARGLRERVELVAGDIFTGVEARADVYLLKDVLHDWDDERCARILAVVRAALPAGASLLLVETPQERNVAPLTAELQDLQMLTQCDGGRQRSVAELQALLRGAGLTPGAVRHTAAQSLVEGVA
jgi:hypothetical protein